MGIGTSGIASSGTEASATRLLHRATLRHLADIRGLAGVQVFVGQSGEWTEAVRRGEVPPEAHRRILPRFDPEAGGAVEPLAGGQSGWLASYMLGGPGVDLAVILILRGLDPSELQSRLAVIEAKIGWLMVAALADRREGIDSRAIGGRIGADLLLDAARARSRRALADQWIARMESAYQPDLVAVLWVTGGVPALAAVSGGGLIERPSDARGDLEALAAVAVAHRAPMLVEDAPEVEGEGGLAPSDAMLANSGHDRAAEAAAIAERLGAGRALVFPVYDREETAGVVALLFQGGEAGADLRVEGSEVVATLLGEALAIQARAHPRPLRRVAAWFADMARAIFGKTAWKLKLAVALLISALVAAAFVPSDYRPAFTARIEAGDRRIVSAPFDGFLVEAEYQLGDRVADGATLIALEDSDLRLRLAQLTAELGEVDAELQTARAQRDAARVRLLEARREQAETQLALIGRQIEISRFTAPADAVVVGGDAWRRVGDRVRLGEPLLELAAPDGFRILAFIEEDWVAEARPGAVATALLAAYPDRPIPLRLSEIGADPQVIDGANTFPAWFEITTPIEADILDGMRGVVRLDVGERSALMAYSRGLRRWVERTAWRLGLDGATG
jgi:multidrug resistance efflux pump